jgi:Ca2+-dependent lipid-binding protein
MVTIMGDKWDYPELLVTPVGTLFVNVRSAKLKRSSDLLTGTADPYVPPHVPIRSVSCSPFRSLPIRPHFSARNAQASAESRIGERD